MKNPKLLRQNKIMALLTEHEFISIKDICQLLDVSEMTTRRDVFELKQKHEIRFINGILVKKEKDDAKKHYHVDVVKDDFLSEKHRVGKFAADMIEEGDAIAIDLGTTTIHIIKHLPENMDILVLCNALNVLNELRKKNIKKIVFTGGNYREATQIFESEEGLELLKKYRTAKAFISAAGFSTKFGATCMNMYEVPFKKTIMQTATQKILLLDSSKYEKVRPAFFAESTEFDHIITTTAFNETDLTYLQEQRTTITVV